MDRQSLILVRHGETLHNVAGIAQGWNDSALSPRGEEQVRRLAARLATMRVDALYSSPLSRALATARVIAEATGVNIVTLDDLREMSYGSWEGQSFLDVRAADEAAYQRWIGDMEEPCPGGGESHNDVLRRMQRAFRSIEGMRPVLVSHGTAIRVGATSLLDVPVTASRHFAQDNASINRFVRRNDRWVLKVWNDTTHCGEDT